MEVQRVHDVWAGSQSTRSIYPRMLNASEGPKVGTIPRGIVGNGALHSPCISVIPSESYQDYTAIPIEQKLW